MRKKSLHFRTVWYDDTTRNNGLNNVSKNVSYSYIYLVCITCTTRVYTALRTAAVRGYCCRTEYGPSIRNRDTDPAYSSSTWATDSSARKTG